MKRLFWVLPAACLAVLALRYFSGAVGSPNLADRNPESQPAASTAVPSAGRHPAAAASTTEAQPDPRGPRPAEGLWQGFVSWIGLSGRPAKDASAGSREEKPGAPAKPQGPGGGGGMEGRDAFASSISGKVLDEAGRPVPWMDVTAEPLQLFHVPEGASLQGPAAQARSDEAGGYRFEQLAEGEYRVQTVATDLYPPAEIVVRTGVDSADLVVSGERRLSIQGLVTDSRGNPLEGVRIGSAGTPSVEVSTGPDGSYRTDVSIPRSERSCILKFQLAGYREEARQLNESQIQGGSIQLDAVLSPVKSTAVVAGMVTDKEGRVLGGEIVYLLGPERYQAVTDRDGLFALADVEAGRSYTLRIPLHGPYRPYVQQVQVGMKGVLLDVVAERGMPESGSLSGRMMDAAGNPLPRFTLWLQSLNPEARGLVQVTSDDNGRYSIEEVPLGALSFMTQSQPRFFVRGISLPAGGAENVDLILDWAGYEVRGQVVDFQDRPVPGARVTLFWSFQNSGILSQSEREAATDANGLFRFAHVGPGVHSIRVSSPGVANARVERNVGVDFGAVVVRLEGDAPMALIRD